MAKVTPQSVNYSKSTMRRDRCGACRHFEPPKSCKLVAGRIDPSYWCKLFERASNGK